MGIAVISLVSRPVATTSTTNNKMGVKPSKLGAKGVVFGEDKSLGDVEDCTALT